MEAFNELYKIYSVKAMRTAYLITGRKNLAEEIVQEAFIQCFKEIKKLKDTASFSSWFFRMLARISWRYCSKEKMHIPIEDINENSNILESKGERISDLIELKEFRTLLDKALYKLNPVLRTTVILYYYNEQSIKQISRITGCLEGTVKSRLHKARKLLEKELCHKEFNGYNYSERKCNPDASTGTI